VLADEAGRFALVAKAQVLELHHGDHRVVVVGLHEITGCTREETVMTPARRTLRARLLRNARGANLVEAALLTPLLLMVSFAIIEFGAIFWVYLALENGVSQASRYAITGQIVAGKDRESSIKEAMRKATPSLTLDDAAFSFSHLPANPPGSTTWVAGTGGPSDIGKVTVTYTWKVYTPILRPFFTPNGDITFVVESAMKNEQYEVAP
jgi:Flp pilus assembly protein TadG